MTDMEKTLYDALIPFADFADPRNVVPRDFVVTVGTGYARRQLTMGDCYSARRAMIEFKSRDS